MKKDVTYLSADKLKGRKTGSPGEKKAAKYIIQQFERNGLLKKGDNGYLQEFKKTIKRNPHSSIKTKEINGANVIGYCNNNQDKTIIIGAHYDHLGYGDFGSLHKGEKDIHNGADDNASGVSVLINLVNRLCANQFYNYLFISFSGEEQGLLGSSYFSENPTIDLSTVKFMINFDMVGRLNQNNELAINGVGTSSKWNDLITSTNKYFNCKLIKSESGTGPSDHTAFYLKNIPVLHFFTGQHEDYHKPSDDVEKINFEGMYTIMSFVDTLINYSSRIENFDFQETEHETKKISQFKVTLGIMPNYLYDGNGLKIDGVTKNKTAYKSGLLKGDIIVKMGDTKVKDIYDYMKALGHFSQNDSTIIIINRNGEEISIAIKFE